MRKWFPFWILLLYIPFICQGAKPIILTANNQTVLFKGAYVDHFEDPTNKLTISEIASLSFKFLPGKSDIIESNKNIKSTYWLRLQVFNKTNAIESFLTELYDFRIHYYELYIFKGKKLLVFEKGGAYQPFYEKKYIHKNFIHSFIIEPNSSITIYYKIKSPNSVSFIGNVRSFKRLLQYSNSEYFLLALFYGAIVSMAIYNLFIFIAVQDKTYLYYVLYVISVGIYSMSQDGLGFQYIWFRFPALNNYVFDLSGYFVTFWVMLYSRRFLNTWEISKNLDKIIILLLCIRTVILVIVLIDIKITTRWIDLFLIFFIYLIAILFLISGKKVARFFVIAFSVFFFGYLITFLLIFNLIKSTPFAIYSFNIGVVGEMLLFSFALADRIKMINDENSRNQKILLNQSKDKEHFIQNINKELEDKVIERSKLLEERNKELDSFIYQSSHDIKGPLKSIIGLSTIALLEVEDKLAVNYFEKLLECSKKLDKVNSNLLSLMDFTHSEIKIKSINFEKLIARIIRPIEANNKYAFIKIKIQIRQDEHFYSDLSIVKIILKDIIDTAIIFADPSRDESLLKVEIVVKNNRAKLHLFGNGKGIPQKAIDEMYNPFSSILYKSENNFLGLYLLKKYTEKINGVFTFSSIPNQATCFDIELKGYSKN